MALRFGDFELDEERCHLRHESADLPLEKRTFEVLRYFIRHPKRLIAKEELLKEVWGVRSLSGGVVSNTVAKVRKALGQPADKDFPIETIHGRGYVFHLAASAPAPSTEALAPLVAPSHQDPFVGRDAVLQTLTAALHRAQQGGSSLYLLVGEAGMGKSRTTRELSRIAEGLGFAVCMGAAHEGEGAPPFWIWIQLLRDAHLQLPQDTWEAATRRGLGPLSPWLSESATKSLTVSAPEPVATRFLVFDAVAHWAEVASRDIPLLLVLEDLHFADTASLELLAFATRALERRRILLVGTLRDEDVKAAPEREDAVTALGRRSTRIDLRPLSNEDGAELVRRLLQDASLPDHLQQQVYRRAEGNPYFIRQILDWLSRNTPSTATVEVDVDLPPVVRDVLRRKLALLPPETREPLDVAAVMGREVGLSLLADVLGRPPETVLGQLEPALTLGILEPIPSTDRFSFQHDLLRETAYDDLGVRQRGSIHKRIADALAQRLYPQGLLPDPLSVDATPVAFGPEPKETALPWALGQLAHHYLNALPSDLETAARACRLAAREARECAGFESAVYFLGRALNKVDAEHGSRTSRFELLLELGANELYLASTMRAWNAYEQAARTALSMARSDLLARVGPRLVDCIDGGCGSTEFAREVLDAALRSTTDEDPIGRAILLANRAEVADAADPKTAEQWLDESQALAEKSGAPSALLEVAHSRAILRNPRHVEESARAARHLLELMDEHTMETDSIRYRSIRRLTALTTLYLSALTSFDLLGADGALNRILALSASSHVKAVEHIATLIQSGRAQAEGRLDDSTRYLDQLELGLGPAMPATLSEALRAMRLGIIEAGGTVSTPLSFDLPQVLDVETIPSHQRWAIHIGRAYLQARTLRLHEAADCLALVPRSAIDAMPHRSGDLGLLWLLGDTYATLDDREGCRRVYERLRPFAHRNAVLPTFQYKGAVAYVLSTLSTKLGDKAEARRLCQLAVDIHRAFPMPAVLAAAERDLKALSA